MQSTDYTPTSPMDEDSMSSGTWSVDYSVIVPLDPDDTLRPKTPNCSPEEPEVPVRSNTRSFPLLPHALSRENTEAVQVWSMECFQGIMMYEDEDEEMQSVSCHDTYGTDNEDGVVDEKTLDKIYHDIYGVDSDDGGQAGGEDDDQADDSALALEWNET